MMITEVIGYAFIAKAYVLFLGKLFLHTFHFSFDLHSFYS